MNLWRSCALPAGLLCWQTPGMSKNALRAAAAGAALLLVALAAYWHWSPYLTMRSLQQAAEKNDGDAFNDHVDYPALRESMKGQFAARMAATMGKDAKDNPFAALGTMLAMAMVNQMVDSLVRPESMMAAMQSGKVDAKAAIGTRAESSTSTEPRKRVHWIFERKGADRLIAYPSESEAMPPEAERVGFVFQRRGFADWKLTELRLPG